MWTVVRGKFVSVKSLRDQVSPEDRAQVASHGSLSPLIQSLLLDVLFFIKRVLITPYRATRILALKFLHETGVILGN